MSDGGKGSKQRPTDHEKYSNNWDTIFGKKKSVPMPGTIGGAKLIFKDDNEQSKSAEPNANVDSQ
jgi:hypothetical protein